jgi:hypothetical protein
MGDACIFIIGQRFAENIVILREFFLRSMAHGAEFRRTPEFHMPAYGANKNIWRRSRLFLVFGKNFENRTGGNGKRRSPDCCRIQKFPAADTVFLKIHKSSLFDLNVDKTNLYNCINEKFLLVIAQSNHKLAIFMPNSEPLENPYFNLIDYCFTN